MTSKRRYVVASASPPTTSDSSASDEDANDISNKKRKCTRRNKPNYIETNTKAHYRESYVFSTALANLAASAVKHRMCDTIIIYHQGIPREPNRLTIKPPKVTSKLLATSSVKNRKLEKQEKRRKEEESEEKPRREHKPQKAIEPRKEEQAEEAPEQEEEEDEEEGCSKPRNGRQTPLTPPRSPKLPKISGDYSLSVSERIKCRSRACAPKFYGENKDEKEEKEEVSEERAAKRAEKSRSAVVTTGTQERESRPRETRESRRRSAEKVSKKQSQERSQRLLNRRDSIESDGEKIRNILENSSKVIPAEVEPTKETTPVEIKPEPLPEPSQVQVPKTPKDPPKTPKQSPKIPKDPPKTPIDSPKATKEPLKTTPKEPPKPAKSPKISKPEKRMMSPRRETKAPPKASPKAPAPMKTERAPVRPRLSDTGCDGLFDAALSQKLKSPRLKKQVSSESKTPTGLSLEAKTPTGFSLEPKTPTGVTSDLKTQVSTESRAELADANSAVSKFKPVKQSSPGKEAAAPPTPETQDMPKFKPLPFSGNQKKSRSFKFRTTQGAKHDMNLVDSIFSTDSNNPPELSPLNAKSPTTPPVNLPNNKIPVTKLTDKPPRPELVMGIPNLQGPSKPPMLTPAHNTILQHGAIQHIIRTGPPPLSSPKITVTTKAPQSNCSPTVNHMTASKRSSSENYPSQERKKKRFVFPTEEASSPVKVTSPISPKSPITLKGPGSTRVSPISPQTNVDNILATPILRNGLPLHKPSPKNSPQNRRGPLEFLADFSGRRSPLVKVNNTSPITPKASPSTVGQFYQPNVSLTSCSRNELTMSESVIEHSKLSGQQSNSRAPVVTINHQTISLEQERNKEPAPKARLTVENDAFSKKQQQEIFARQQLFSRAFSPYSFPNSIPTTTSSKLNKQFELTQQLKQQDLGSLVDLYGRAEKDVQSQPAFPTAHLRQPSASSLRQAGLQRQGNPRGQRSIPANITTELLVQQERERLLSQQQERLLAQQRQHAATSSTRGPDPRDQGHAALFSSRQESLLQQHRSAGNPNQHLQHIPYSSGMLNQLGYPIGLNPQLYKQLASDPALTQVTSASILQSLAGYHHQLQLAAAAAGKFGPLAHLYQSSGTKQGSEHGRDKNTPTQYGVIRP